MENEVKKCPVCHTVIPEDSKATYCCSKKECEKCGWNPVVERRRKEALVCHPI